jgi:DNA-binding response OmpR family regulator
MNILLIEDDELIAEFTRQVLRNEDFNVSISYDGVDGFNKASKKRYDVILLDVLLPNKDGFSICRDLRRAKNMTPIIMLSSQAGEDSKVDGLDYGADDYLTKPFSHKELVARIRAVTRRPSAVVQSKLSIVDLELDPQGHLVTRGGKTILLRPKEYELLEFMMRNQDVALPKHVLLHNVWGIRSEAASNRLEVYIKHLRHKIDKPYKRHLIHTVHGIGYKLAVL